MAGTALNIGSLSRYGGRIWSLSRRLTGAALPLDALAADILGAYSFRRLRTGYSGPAVRVRRDSDNTEQDIGFTPAGLLDTQAVTTFCGAGNGFVTTVYDQSLTPRNVTQATASLQPTIVSAGVLQVMNARPVMRWPDAQNSVALAYSGTGSPGTHIVVGQYSGPNPFDFTRAAFTFQDADGTNAGLTFLGSAGGTTFSRPAHLNGATVASTTALPTVQSPFIGRNSVAPTPNRNQWWIGGDRGIANRGWRGPIAETLLFSRTLSASEIAALQSNLSEFYGIPLV